MAGALAAQPARPPIVGIAHFALKTSDLEKARAFYGKELGLPEAFTAGGAVWFQVNLHQYVEVRPGLKEPGEDRLVHIAFETTDVRRLRAYLAAKGVAAPAVAPLEDGNPGFAVRDPEGHEIVFVQYAGKGRRKPVAAPRISERIIHAGMTFQDRAAANRFYRDILGFEETWYGGRNDTTTDWVDMRVPEGKDWLEYMLNVHNPSPRTLGVMHHFGLGAPSVAAAEERLVQGGFTTEKPKIGRDGKWQLNLYDPDLTRVELMEPKPVETPCCSAMKME
jgi:catechol 2,3-dioxygenase-like lactoylglutathione lyase family enzyme